MDLYGRDFIVSQEWSRDELFALLDLAAKMKRERYSPYGGSTQPPLLYQRLIVPVLQRVLRQ